MQSLSLLPRDVIDNIRENIHTAYTYENTKSNWVGYWHTVVNSETIRMAESLVYLNDSSLMDDAIV